MSPLAVTAGTFAKVVTVLDTSIATSPSTFAVHALASDSTIFLSGPEIVQYLKSLETPDTKIIEVDFEALKAESGGAAPNAPGATKTNVQKQEKEDAKIEGAVQIAIGVKKEVDFASWYTNVGRPILLCLRVF